MRTHCYPSALALLLVLVFPVAPAYAAPVVEVSVLGIEGALLANVLAYLSIEQQKNDPNLSEGRIRGLYEKAPDEIKTALQPFGYYRPGIRSELIRRGKGFLARYTIYPGKPVRIREVNLAFSGEGSYDEELRKVRKNFPVKNGNVLEHAVYEKAKQELQETAVEQGYLDARFLTHTVRVYPEQDAAVVDLHFETGPLYRFGDVTFNQDILKNKFLERFVPFKKGDPYKTAKLLELQNALYSSDYFRQVDIRPRRDKAEGLNIPLEIDLSPRKRNKYMFGLGYGTDTGFRGILGWEDRWINRRGHRFSTELRLSQIQKNLTARYIVPVDHPATDHLDYTAAWVDERTAVSKSETRLVGASYNRSRPVRQESYYLNYQKERFSLGDESGRATLLLPGASWTRIKADDRIYTSRGSRIIMDVRGAHTALFSSVSFAQLRLNAKFIRRPWDPGRIILRGDFGYSFIAGFADLPVSQRFFAGGDQSVRGYAYRSLGPLDSAGNVIGGRDLVVGSAEYEQRIYGKWGAAVFYDIGNAINKLSDPLKQGTGVGVRWRSPVGLVRLDFAWALNALSASNHTRWRIHLNIGPDL